MTDEEYDPPCTLTPAIIRLVAEISETVGRLDRGGSQGLRLRRANRIRTVHGSLAIEGNNLSQEQITAILDGKRVLAPPKDIQEVKNALDAYEHFHTWQPPKSALMSPPKSQDYSRCSKEK